MNQYAVANALMSLFHNESPCRLAEAMFPGRHPGYLNEWVERFTRGAAYATGCMDEDTFRRLVDMAIDKYGQAASERFPD